MNNIIRLLEALSYQGETLLPERYNFYVPKLELTEQEQEELYQAVWYKFIVMNEDETHIYDNFLRGPLTGETARLLVQVYDDADMVEGEEEMWCQECAVGVRNMLGLKGVAQCLAEFPPKNPVFLRLLQK